jgi:hypothetical protein
VTLLEDRPDVELADGIYEATASWEGMVRQPAGALVASAIPVKPPTAWFGNPGFTRLEPLTIRSDGQVSGHIASWREDHIGMSGRVKAPRSKSNYAFFATGVLETAEGNLVNVGQITLTGGHAPLEASVAEAVAHYDNTQSAIMDVACGEDKHGIWVAGALRPTVTEHELRAIRASSVSGDWRPINGSLEMVAVCAVNVPGFPIPRARVASGVPVALVAAGTGELVDLMLHDGTVDTEAITAAFDDRLRFVEDLLLGGIGDKREALTAAIEQARLAADPQAMAAALRARVHAPEREAVLASLRQRVHADDDVEPLTEQETVVASLRARAAGPQLWDEDQMPIEATGELCHQLVLRASVHGGLTATATSTWDAKHRKQAADKGVAMPDGSFPIRDRRDLEKAIKALGRAKDPAKARRHIRKRAKALGAESALPDSW